jgi:DNA-binding SARP family transcriptional activator
MGSSARGATPPPADCDTLALRLLGSFQLMRGDESVAVPMSAQRLLVFLALRRHGVARSHVAASLWMDALEERAAASLRSALWRLHQTGSDAVDSSDGRLALRPQVRVDVRRSADLARALLDMRLGPGLPDGWQDLACDLLPDWRDEWLAPEREHHRGIGLQALDVLSERLLAAGDVGHALEVAIRTVACEPLRESANRLLMSAHLADGNPSEALRQYRVYRRLLARELGLAPSRRMENLVAPLIAARLARSRLRIAANG